MQQAQPLARQVVVVVDGSSYMEPYWKSLYETCVHPALTFLDVRAKDNTAAVKTEYALVTFYEHTPYGDRLLRTHFFTPKLPVFDSWAKSMEFEGGGYAQNAVTEGLAAALDLLDSDAPVKDPKNTDRYVLLVTNSRQHDAPCRLPGAEQGMEMLEIINAFSNRGILLSVFLPHSLDPLRSGMRKVFELGKPNQALNFDPPHSENLLPEIDHVAFLRGIQLTTCKTVDRNILVHTANPNTVTPAPAPSGATPGQAVPGTGQAAAPQNAAMLHQQKLQQQQALAGQKRDRPEVDKTQNAAILQQPLAKRAATGDAQASQYAGLPPQGAQGHQGTPPHILQMNRQLTAQQQQQQQQQARGGMMPTSTHHGAPPQVVAASQMAKPGSTHAMPANRQAIAPQAAQLAAQQKQQQQLAGQQQRPGQSPTPAMQAQRPGQSPTPAMQAQPQRPGQSPTPGMQGQTARSPSMAQQHAAQQQRQQQLTAQQQQQQRQQAMAAGAGAGQQQHQQRTQSPAQQQQSSTASSAPAPSFPSVVVHAMLWQGDFITIKDGKPQPFCSAIGCVASNQKATQQQRNELQNMIHSVFQDTVDRTRPMEIKKFEEASKLPDMSNVCLCFMEQQGPGATPNDKFRKLHISLAKHNKFAYIIAHTKAGPRMFALTPDGQPTSQNTQDWRLLAVPVQTVQNPPRAISGGGYPGGGGPSPQAAQVAGRGGGVSPNEMALLKQQQQQQLSQQQRAQQQQQQQQGNTVRR